LAYPLDSNQQGYYTDEVISFCAARHQRFYEDPIQPTGRVESLESLTHESRI
jgi:hypothetical protein